MRTDDSSSEGQTRGAAFVTTHWSVVLASADQDGFAQLRSRDRVAFRAVTAEQAAQAARSRRTALQQYLRALGCR